MNTQLSANNKVAVNSNRNQLLEAINVSEHFLELAGIHTPVIKRGEGPPIILLHGPGESALWWMRVIPKLSRNYRVIAPDLPGHGASKVNVDSLDADLVNRWLSDLIEETCYSKPVMVGHLMGGSIAARFAINQEERLDSLVLVNSFGLGKFRPAPAFAYRLVRFLLRPTEKNYQRFLPHCMYDVNDLQKQMGDLWKPFEAYNLDKAQDPDQKAALQTLMKEVGVPRIPSEDLARIDIPVFLIWGRHDRANKLQIAESASKRYGWPLQVIEEARDEPKLERPENFIEVLYNSLSETSENNSNK